MVLQALELLQPDSAEVFDRRHIVDNNAPTNHMRYDMTGKKAKFARTRLFVDTKVQGSLIRQLIIHWALACFLIFLYLFTLQTFANGFSLDFQQNLAELWKRHGLLALVLLVISPVFIYDSMKLSNRFVGPMISFRGALKKLAQGENPDAINFRQNDFWKELTADLNKISAELKELRTEKAANGVVPEGVRSQ